MAFFISQRQEGFLGPISFELISPLSLIFPPTLPTTEAVLKVLKSLMLGVTTFRVALLLSFTTALTLHATRLPRIWRWER